MLVDIHAKSSISPDCSIDLNEVIKRAKASGLDGIAFCETLSTARCQETLEACKAAGIRGFIGVEIPTDKGVLIGFAPEIDEFYLAEEWRQLTEIMTPPAAQVIQLFHEHGGVVIAARPYDLDIAHNMGDLIFTLEGIQAVEVFNSRVGKLQCDFALEAASFMNVPTVGGSDPNGSADIVGTFATFFGSEINTQREFVEALLDNDFWAVQLGGSSSDSTSRKDDGRKRGGRGESGGGRGGDRRGGGRSGGGRSGGDRNGGGRSGGGRGGDRRGGGRKRD